MPPFRVMVAASLIRLVLLLVPASNSVPPEFTVMFVVPDNRGVVVPLLSKRRVPLVITVCPT